MLCKVILVLAEMKQRAFCLLGFLCFKTLLSPEFIVRRWRGWLLSQAVGPLDCYKSSISFLLTPRGHAVGPSGSTQSQIYLGNARFISPGPGSNARILSLAATPLKPQ